MASVSKDHKSMPASSLRSFKEDGGDAMRLENKHWDTFCSFSIRV